LIIAGDQLAGCSISQFVPLQNKNVTVNVICDGLLMARSQRLLL